MSPLRLDLHVHSRHSPDSSIDLSAVVAQLGLAGLQGFALTDHNTVEGHAELHELARENPRYLFIPGVEVSTRQGHLLALGVSDLPPIRRPVDETVAWVDAHGGVAIPPHPMRWSHGLGRRTLERLRVASIETVNGHNSELANARAELVAARRGWGSTGGSDAHSIGEIGRAFTEFPDTVHDSRAAIEVLRAGHALAAGRPLGTGERIRLGIRTGLLRAARGFRPI